MPITRRSFMQGAAAGTLLEAGAVKKRLPLDEHYTSEFTPVRL